jgi:cell division septation protein DedD
MTRSTAPLLLGLLCALLCAASASASTAQAAGRTIADATAAYHAKDFRRAAAVARLVGDRASGTEREGARYLEGLSLFQSGELDAAAAVLRVSAASREQYIASQSQITLASIEIERKRWDAAGYAYRRAAELLTGPESKRANSYAARCFDAAGLAILADEARAAAGEARAAAGEARAAAGEARAAVGEARAAAGGPPQQPRPVAIQDESPRRTVTADDKPIPQNRIGAQPATRPAVSDAGPRNSTSPLFAVQVGAFTSIERANEIAAALKAQCTAIDIECPRVITRHGDGATLHIVQFGCFPNRGVANKVLLKFPKSAYRVEPYCATDAAAR